MPSKEFHLNRIEELKFQRDVKINRNNRTHTALIALASITVIFFMFELQLEKRFWWIFALAIVFLILLWAINRAVTYPENEEIQRNFDALLGRKNKVLRKIKDI